ncbi:benzoyl-CoA 2,3-epoxidase subunit BoxA [Aquicoccus sp. G2-2]|uniref:benzoyl-CoA 2,3-epoxidase subunit BoxA n=1 Tax=Aquicoccus sp. G2-2 TaxID=3092120 RepID=UPI002ADF8FE4|nr:benzoyl-CoA 2,3-epoxidase subunit BoxA [Aquicoccus sp. G2-2]MEA1114353.1 benzoyl-CoA 2,3-epoxidase subunit BoxA [Aquicoccus sp. G2-2]
MNKPVKQHLIDPEICIRCYTCEMTCPIQAITHDDENVVVDFDICNFCMDCIPVCPTGSIDEWRVVTKPYTLEEQFGWSELPEQEDIEEGGDAGMEALDEEMAALLAKAHEGAGGKAVAPASASKASVNLYTLGKPAVAKVQGTYRLTAEGADSDVRHIILDFGGQPMPVLEGQSIGIIPPGEDENGKPHLPRLYSISSPRDGERPGYNNLSLTVKRDEGGLCSNYVCNLKKGDEVQVTGPFGATFLMPNDSDARMLMICTGTGSAPFRAFTMHRQRMQDSRNGDMVLFFGARTPDSLPYFGPLNKVPDRLLKKHMVFSRIPGTDKEYVQDRMMVEQEAIAEIIADPKTHVFVCGLKGMELGVDQAFANIAESAGISWNAARDAMREEGRYHVETY